MEYKGLTLEEKKMGGGKKAKTLYHTTFPKFHFSKKQDHDGWLSSTNIRLLLNKIDAQEKYWKSKK